APRAGSSSSTRVEPRPASSPTPAAAGSKNRADALVAELNALAGAQPCSTVWRRDPLPARGRTFAPDGEDDPRGRDPARARPSLRTQRGARRVEAAHPAD